jgi:hypothetical protein
LKEDGMFNVMKMEFKELLELVREIATFDATLSADRTITPTPESKDDRRRKEQRLIDLKHKYELF